MKQYFPAFYRMVDWLRRSLRRRRAPSVRSKTRRSERWARCDRESMLRLMAVAADNRIPLGPLLKAFSEDAGHRDRERIGRFAELLENGTSLADALEQNPRLASDDTILAVRTGTQTGTLGSTLRAELRSDDFSGRRRVGANILGNFLYLVIVVAVLTTLVTFIAVKIAPTLDQIIVDLNVEFPPAFRSGLTLARAVAQWLWLGTLLSIVAAFVILAGRFNRSLRRGWLGAFSQTWFGSQTAGVLQNLSVASSSGRPLAGVVSTMARYHYRPAIRHRLLFVSNELEHGAGLWETLRGARLITGDELRLLETATRVGNTGWVLRQLAAKRRHRVNQRRSTLAQLVFPVCILALGGLVLWVGLAVFGSLVQMIKVMA